MFPATSLPASVMVAVWLRGSRLSVVQDGHVTFQRVADARLIIEWCPDLIDAVNLARLAEGLASRH
jgi:hypothetical protein